MNLEAVHQLRDKALGDFSLVTHHEFGLVASPEGYRFNNYFTRAAMRSGMAITEKLDLETAPSVLPFIIKSEEVAIDNIGVKSEPETGELEDLLPHEFHNKNSPQDRLIELGKQLPVRVNPDGSRELVTYFADDVNSLFRSCICNTGRALAQLEGIDTQRAYYAKRWPIMVRTL